MREVPVVVLQGPRSVGKSTVLNEIARQHSASVINLDLPGMRRAVQADPTQFVEGPGPVFVDEYQRVPDILDAIKAEVDADYRPGRFLLTGSTRFDVLPRSSQTLTGRPDSSKSSSDSGTTYGQRTTNLLPLRGGHPFKTSARSWPVRFRVSTTPIGTDLR
jgi:predicted AAA+ superfamily ATPase